MSYFRSFPVASAANILNEGSKIKPNVQLPNADGQCSRAASSGAELFPKDDQKQKQNDGLVATPYTDTKESTLKEERVVSFNDQNRAKKENCSKPFAPKDENQNLIKPNADLEDGPVDEAVKAEVDLKVTVSEEPIFFSDNREKKEDALCKHNCD